MRWIKLMVALVCVALAFGAIAAAPADVADEVGKLQQSAEEHQVVLLGEKHGTREIPAFVADLVAAIAERHPVILALEIPQTEQAALAKFLASNGGPDARARLKKSAFWVVDGDQNDGRRNEDAIDLIDTVRSLRAAGRDADVLAFDVAAGSTRDHHERDRAMAQTLRAAITASPQARFVVLTGNVHAMLKRPDHAPPQMQQPMGSFLTDLDVFAVNIDARGGQFWGCTDHCQPRNVPASERQSGGVGNGVYHYELILPRFSVARLLGAK
jgi:hypothetical protein